MKCTQLLTFEVGTDCNLSAAHHLHCPIAIPDRFAAVNTSHPMPDDTIVVAINTAVDAGFCGMVSYHSYCEPLLYIDRIEHIISSTPNARHLLWTNGTLINSGVPSHRLSIFDKIIVSNYLRRDWRWLTNVVPEVQVVSGVLDNRLRRGRHTTAACFRLYHELVIDHYGNWHLCCGDPLGGTVHLNIHTDGMQKIMDAHIHMRTIIATHPQPPPPSTPTICNRCSVRGRTAVYRLVDAPFHHTRHHLITSGIALHIQADKLWL